MDQPHPIFRNIEGDDLEAAVQQHVRADATVLDEQASDTRSTPLMHVIARNTARAPEASTTWRQEIALASLLCTGHRGTARWRPCRRSWRQVLT